MEIREAAQALVEGTLLGNYKFKGYKQAKAKAEAQAKVKGLTLIEIDSKKIKSIKEGVRLGEVLAKAKINCHLLIIDTEGYSVDMAVYLEIFSGEKVRDAILDSNLKSVVNHKKLIIPGLAKKYKDDIEKETGWEILVGPVCAAEVPIYLLSKNLID